MRKEENGLAFLINSWRFELGAAGDGEGGGGGSEGQNW